jgi:hypothetical protein
MTNLKFQDVLDNPYKLWSIIGLSYNSNITLTNMLEHPEFPWDFEKEFIINIITW